MLYLLVVLTFSGPADQAPLALASTVHYDSLDDCNKSANALNTELFPDDHAEEHHAVCITRKSQ